MKKWEAWQLGVEGNFRLSLSHLALLPQRQGAQNSK